MNAPIELPLGDIPVRFTSDGWVFIEDAIKALTGELEDRPELVWKRVKKDHPDILNHCSSYVTKEGKKIQTIDIEGMDKIYLLLLEYI
jgi:hypothetical protein